MTPTTRARLAAVLRDGSAQSSWAPPPARPADALDYGLHDLRRAMRARAAVRRLQCGAFSVGCIAALAWTWALAYTHAPLVAWWVPAAIAAGTVAGTWALGRVGR